MKWALCINSPRKMISLQFPVPSKHTIINLTTQYEFEIIDKSSLPYDTTSSRSDHVLASKSLIISFTQYKLLIFKRTNAVTYVVSARAAMVGTWPR